MTLPEAITKLRAHYQHVLEVEARATKGPWYSEDHPHNQPEQCYASVSSSKAFVGHELFDTSNRGYKESGLERDSTGDDKWRDHRGASDLELAALSRNSIAPTARLVLELIKYDGCPAGQLCTEQERCYRCAALIACAEELEEAK